MLPDFFSANPKTRRARKFTAYVLIFVAVSLLYMRRDVIIEPLQGRPLGQVDLTRLLLPIILFLAAFFLMAGKKHKKDKTPQDGKQN